MITASFLTHGLKINWRHGYRHFACLLADGDVASNAGNWQWVAGTGHNRRPNRVMNPLRQTQRFDPAGDYVRRYVPELSGLPRSEAGKPQKGQTPCRARRLSMEAAVHPCSLLASAAADTCLPTRRTRYSSAYVDDGMLVSIS